MPHVKSVKSKKTSVVVGVRFSEKNYEFLQLLCKQNNLSQGEMINKIFDIYRLECGKWQQVEN